VGVVVVATGAVAVLVGLEQEPLYPLRLALITLLLLAVLGHLQQIIKKEAAVVIQYSAPSHLLEEEEVVVVMLEALV